MDKMFSTGFVYFLYVQKCSKRFSLFQWRCYGLFLVSNSGWISLCLDLVGGIQFFSNHHNKRRGKYDTAVGKVIHRRLEVMKCAYMLISLSTPGWSCSIFVSNCLLHGVFVAIAICGNERANASSVGLCDLSYLVRSHFQELIFKRTCNYLCSSVRISLVQGKQSRAAKGGAARNQIGTTLTHHNWQLKLNQRVGVVRIECKCRIWYCYNNNLIQVIEMQIWLSRQCQLSRNQWRERKMGTIDCTFALFAEMADLEPMIYN